MTVRRGLGRREMVQRRKRGTAGDGMSNQGSADVGPHASICVEEQTEFLFCDLCRHAWTLISQRKSCSRIRSDPGHLEPSTEVCISS